MLLEKLGDIKEMILEQVKDFVITKIITAGITWLIGLLNPAAAFIKACKMIYDVVMFFVDNGSRILKFVNTVIDSVADIVKGNVSGVVNKINDVLGQMVPIIIGFLASLVGLGGIGQKIRAIVETLQKPVTKALDFVIKTGLKLAGPIIRGIKGISGKVKAKVAAGKAWVKGKVEAGKQWAKDRAPGRSGSGPNRHTHVQLSGQPHTLRAFTQGNRLRVTMASANSGDLIAKAADARKAQEHANNSAGVTELSTFVSHFQPRITEIENSPLKEENKTVAMDNLLREMAAELVAIGAHHHLRDLGSYSAIGLPEIELKRLVYEAINTARGMMLRQRAGTSTAPTAGDDLQTQFDRVIREAAGRYDAACRVRLSQPRDVGGFRGNVFTFAGRSYFVDHRNNDVVPDDMVGTSRGTVGGKVYVSTRPQLTREDDLTGDPRRKKVIDPFGYEHHTHSSGQFRTFAELVARGGTLPPVDGTIFLAAMIAEARRNPNAHVTNMLLITTGDSERFMNKAPMTGGKTDTATAPRDPTLASVPGTRNQPPTFVTDDEIALVRQSYEQRQKAPLTELVTEPDYGGPVAIRRDLIKFLTTEATRPAGWRI